MDDDIALLWQRIERFAKQRMPGLLAELNGPADPAAVARLEKRLGFKLPADFARSVAVHDGEDGDGCLFDDAGALLPVELIEEYLEQEASGLRDYSDLEAEEPGGPVKPPLFHPRRIPIADINGDETWLLDLDPAPGGVPGQVVRRDIEGGSLEVVAASFREFLSDYVTRLEQGKATFDPELAAELAQPPPVDAPARKEREKRFFAVLKSQRKLELKGLADGTEVELVGTLGLPHHSMGPDQYPFQTGGDVLTLNGALGISRQDIMDANRRGDHYMFRIKAVVRRQKRLLFPATVELSLVSYVPFD